MVTDFPVPFVNLSTVNSVCCREAMRDRIASITYRSDYIDGPEVTAFEERWADYVGAKYCVGVANGTDALELAVRGVWGARTVTALSMPASSFVATAEAVVRAGEQVMLSDVDPVTLMQYDDIGLDICVGLYGQPVHQKGGVVDAAQMHGHRLPGVTASWSFYPTKNLGAWGDAGAVTTDDQGLADGIRELARHGYNGRVGPGFNSRLDTIQAAVLLEKLPHLDEWVEARRQIVAGYERRLHGTGIQLVGDPRTSVCHLAVVRVPLRNAVAREMRAHGVEVGVHYGRALSEMRWLDQYRFDRGQPRPRAEQAAAEVLSLPLWPGMAVGMVDRVVEVLCRAVELAVHEQEVTA